jgi:hypothetical protein
MIEIDSTPIRYFSQKDEDHFFGWAQEIGCVLSVDRGVLSVDAERVADDELRELLALLTRYQLSIEPLRVLANPCNEHWFNDPQAYWNIG